MQRARRQRRQRRFVWRVAWAPQRWRRQRATLQRQVAFGSERGGGGDSGGRCVCGGELTDAGRDSMQRARGEIRGEAEQRLLPELRRLVTAG